MSTHKQREGKLDSEKSMMGGVCVYTSTTGLEKNSMRHFKARKVNRQVEESTALHPAVEIY